MNGDTKCSRRFKLWKNSAKIVALTEDQGDRQNKVQDNTLIEQINEKVAQDLSETESKSYYVNGYVSYIKKDDNTVYMACPECKKKVVEEGSEYRCERCDKVIEKPNPTYILTCKIEDSTGAIFVRFYGDQAK